MLMGSETEFGMVDGWGSAKAGAVQAEVRRLPNLPAARGGVFLANGARVYVDIGNHNEYSTPETEDPSDLVVRELAGRRLMNQCACTADATLLCSNVDPGSGATWGAHENYECAASFDPEHQAALGVHLVTRIIYTGAGGISAEDPGVRLVLSPRAGRIAASAGGRGSRLRSFVHGKPDSSGAHERLHLACGESLLCHRANYLKYATTALVVRCLDLGLMVGPGCFAASPMRVLRRINRDWGLSGRFRMADGCRLSALDVQDAIRRDVARHIDRLPAWAPVALRRWEIVLDQLRSGRASVAAQLDWLVFRRAFVSLAREHGYDEPAIRRMNARVRRAGDDPESEDVARFRAFRASAQELYVRLHVLGEASLFDWLEGCGAVRHRLPEITDSAVCEAVRSPPTGRAANRALLVARLSEGERVEATWDRLYDPLKRRRLAIPVAAGWDGEGSWEAIPMTVSDGPSIRQLALACYQQGQWEDGLALCRQLVDLGFEPASAHCHIARIRIMMDQPEAARAAVDAAWALRGSARCYVSARALYLRALLDLTEGADPMPSLILIKKSLAAPAVHMQWTTAPLLEHVAPRLSADSLHLMRALAAALSERSALPVLESLPAWQLIVVPGEEVPASVRQEAV